MYADNKHSPTQNTHTFLLWFYTEYNKFVYKMAWQTNSHSNDIDDLVQEVWLRLCSKGDLLIDLSRERHLSYISATVRNTAISIARKQVLEYPLEFAQKISYNEAEILNTIFDKQVKIQHFHKVWPLVPLPERELLERKYLLFETDEEIAQSLCIKPSSVRMYLTRARSTAFSILSRYKNDLI